MGSINNKLDKFSNTIYTKATHEKEDIIKKAEKNRANALKEKELDCLETAYLNIQHSIRSIDQQKKEMVSKALMEQKKSLLNRREEIIEEVFSLVKKKLREYTLTEEYKDYLFKTIDANVKQIGEGNIHIIISKNDEKYLQELKERFGHEVILYDGYDDIIGGCIVENVDNRRYINDTLLESLQEKSQEFIKSCNMKSC
ncbi:V-type ATP synthase subunit E [Vallitalea okinawensis]|uniref:V-type ATP synthase subunit E n=1 Tax=Vallitalea okinawensis TaxID=2078660 RepID=UPI000CFC8D38|nr:V-type ATP synthase subunit E family protein [Vallitalea okinawensis]